MSKVTRTQVAKAFVPLINHYPIQELAKPLAGHMDVEAVWSFSSTPLSALVEKEAAANLKRTWVNHARARDWLGGQGEGRVFLRHATAVKTVWVPYGE